MLGYLSVSPSELCYAINSTRVRLIQGYRIRTVQTERKDRSQIWILEAAMTTHSINETNPGKRVVTG